ncbi:hypothetical protein [Rhodoligotrophos defluvii]|uniref:hypothetical protein n=1 Tax=Rhodoligotrophos defluvii TaxID=2561934 RepID=UPI0010C976D0|nr:hypothetical protein [Rhodoligotrophos defluvii]
MGEMPAPTLPAAHSAAAQPQFLPFPPLTGIFEQAIETSTPPKFIGEAVEQRLVDYLKLFVDQKLHEIPGFEARAIDSILNALQSASHQAAQQDGAIPLTEHEIQLWRAELAPELQHLMDVAKTAAQSGSRAGATAEPSMEPSLPAAHGEGGSAEHAAALALDGHGHIDPSQQDFSTPF